jgi:hypothetical protein
MILVVLLKDPESFPVTMYGFLPELFSQKPLANMQHLNTVVLRASCLTYSTHFLTSCKAYLILKCSRQVASIWWATLARPMMGGGPRWAISR